MAGIDKVTRILMMYSRLQEGKKIYKKSFCVDTGIDRRTFDRDIEDIRIFFSESYIGYELIYDRTEGSYYLKNFHPQIPLSPMEVSLLIVLLRSEGILRRDEYTQLVYNIIRAGTWTNQEKFAKLSKKDIENYQDTGSKGVLLKMQWDLQQCICERDVIRLKMGKNVQKVIAPLMLWIDEGELYLIGYNVKEKMDVIPVRKIESFSMEKKKFSIELEKRFKQTDWKKTIEKEKERMQDEEQEKED